LEDPVMTHTLASGRGWTADGHAFGGIFTRSVRRDLADLNRQYLELGLHPEAGVDPLFSWTGEVRREIETADPGVRELMSGCPFTLFELCLPPSNAARGHEACSEPDRVEDRAQGGGPGPGRAVGCISFAHGALFAAWRLANSAPYAARISFGLSPAAELELVEACPTRIAMLATHPGVVRARWPAHSRFWAMLRNAAQAGSVSELQWAHCAGICLMDVACSRAEGRESAAGRGPPRA
jgi:hypothetical protein